MRVGSNTIEQLEVSAAAALASSVILIGREALPATEWLGSSAIRRPVYHLIEKQVVHHHVVFLSVVVVDCLLNSSTACSIVTVLSRRRNNEPDNVDI